LKYEIYLTQLKILQECGDPVSLLADNNTYLYRLVQRNGQANAHRLHNQAVSAKRMKSGLYLPQKCGSMLANI